MQTVQRRILKLAAWDIDTSWDIHVCACLQAAVLKSVDGGVHVDEEPHRDPHQHLPSKYIQDSNFKLKSLPQV